MIFFFLTDLPWFFRHSNLLRSSHQNPTKTWVIFLHWCDFSNFTHLPQFCWCSNSSKLFFLQSSDFTHLSTHHTSKLACYSLTVIQNHFVYPRIIILQGQLDILTVTQNHFIYACILFQGLSASTFLPAVACGRSTVFKECCSVFFPDCNHCTACLEPILYTFYPFFPITIALP